MSLPDNDNNRLLDPNVKARALRDLSKCLAQLHEAIDHASEALERLKDAQTEEDKVN